LAGISERESDLNGCILGKTDIFRLGGLEPDDIMTGFVPNSLQAGSAALAAVIATRLSRSTTES